MKLLIASIALLMFSPVAFGTAVLIVQTEDNTIYLAADAHLEESLTKREYRICKIHRFDGRSYWAAASDFYKTDKGFSVEEIGTSIGAQGTVDEKMKRFVGAVTEPLRKQADMMNSHLRKEFAMYLTKTDRVSLLDVVIVGFDNGKTAWAVTRFFAKENNGRLSINPEPEDNHDRKIATTMNGGGYWGPAGEYVKEHLLEFYADPEKIITKGLEKSASEDVHKGVSGPYAIIRIGKTGHTWVQQGDCKLD
jgi:hypothetical protein